MSRDVIFAYQVAGFVVGRPEGTAYYTHEELICRGVHGIYVPDSVSRDERAAMLSKANRALGRGAPKE